MHSLTVRVTGDSDPRLARSEIAEVLVFVENVNEYPPVVEASERVSLKI